MTPEAKGRFKVIPRYSLDAICQKAYDIMCIAFADRIANFIHANPKKPILIGPDIFKHKNRCVPVCLTRYLLMAYLYDKGWTQNEISRVFNIDRSCVVHARKIIERELTLNYETDFKIAIKMFLNESGNA